MGLLQRLFSCNEDKSIAREKILTSLDVITKDTECVQQKQDVINAALTLVVEMSKLNQEELSDCNVGDRWLSFNSNSNTIKLIED